MSARAIRTSHPRTQAKLRLVGLAFAAGALAGCVEERVVFKRDVFLPPADTTFGFLGYFDEETKLTACGNCHVGQQASWEATGHAEAWAGLQKAGPAVQPFCTGCHSVSERGNDVAQPAGYNLVQDTRYHDVQCESCHGPGFEHVQNPDATQPIARLAVATDVGCGECHQDTHHPFVEQWAASRHGTVPHVNIAASVGSFCLVCHEGKTALAAKFGETAEFVEKADANPMAITCGVCHDPHGSGFEANLRADITVPSFDNLCVKCHARRGTPPSSHGPHAPQGLLVLGENVGWIPPGFTYDTARIVSTHGTEANPRLCATCHVSRFEVTDPQTGDFLFESVGHTFEAIPCLDANGLPTEGPCGVTERDFRACAGAGCHGTPVAARSAYVTVVGRLNNLLDQIWADTDNDSILEPTDGGVLPQVLAKFPTDTTILDVRDGTVTVAEGTLWNAQLAFTSDRRHFERGRVYVGLANGGAGIEFEAQKGSGNGVHNPFLLEALLTASINAVIQEYGLTPSPGLDLSVHATPPPGLRLR